MILINGKRYEFRVMEGFLKKTLGLMFMNKNNLLFLFKNKKRKRIAIHTFFCEPLYLYFFNEKKELIEKVYLKPFRIYFPKKKWKYLIESFKKLDLKEGDKISCDF